MPPARRRRRTAGRDDLEPLACAAPARPGRRRRAGRWPTRRPRAGHPGLRVCVVGRAGGVGEPDQGAPGQVGDEEGDRAGAERSTELAGDRLDGVHRRGGLRHVEHPARPPLRVCPIQLTRRSIGAGQVSVGRGLSPALTHGVDLVPLVGPEGGERRREESVLLLEDVLAQQDQGPLEPSRPGRVASGVPSADAASTSSMTRCSSSSPTTWSPNSSAIAGNSAPSSTRVCGARTAAMSRAGRRRGPARRPARPAEPGRTGSR